MAVNPLVCPKVEPRSRAGRLVGRRSGGLRSAARRASTPEWKQQDPQIPQSIWYYTDALFVGFRVVRPLQEPTAEEKDKMTCGGSRSKQSHKDESAGFVPPRAPMIRFFEIDSATFHRRTGYVRAAPDSDPPAASPPRVSQIVDRGGRRREPGGNLARPSAHAAGDDTIKIGLIGCGGRGTGAASKALSTEGNVKLVAMGDAFKDRLEGSLKGIAEGSSSPSNASMCRRSASSSASMPIKKVLDCGRRPGDSGHAAGLPPDSFRGRR